MAKSKNSNLSDAKRNKNDEFYTQWSDIEREVLLYRDHFKDKVVYLNCDDPEWSNFFKFFAHVFDWFGLMKVISTHYDTEKPTYKIELTRENFRMYANPDGSFNEEAIEDLKIPLIGNGDFRNTECVELLKEADIVVTNPPFSLFREYVAQLIEYEKKFLILGNQNAITYKEIFPLIKNNQIWLGQGSNMSLVFGTPYINELEANRAFVKQKGYDPDKFIKVPGVCWFTNMETPKRKYLLGMYARYYDDITKYPKYDNYDAINVDRVVDIPFDYEGVMGVPITFLDKYNPDQFEILGSQRWSKSQYVLDIYTGAKESAELDMKTLINGKETYDRIFIKHKLKYNEHGIVQREN